MKQVFEVIQSFFMFGLVAAGIGGFVYRTIKEDGWLGSLSDQILNAIVNHPMVTIPVLIGVFVIGKLWHNYQVEKGYTSKLPNFFLYGVMAAGVYFVWHFLATGAL